MAKRAVLIGINYVGTQTELSGCVNDVMDIKDVLVEKFGFPEDDITVLVDDQNDDGEYEEPTGANIKAAIEDAIGASEDGDVLVIHYSGHGGSCEDKSGDEPDGMDEFLCASDSVPIFDDQLNGWFAQLSPGVKFTFIADCCHSGTMLDQPSQDLEVGGRKHADEGQEEGAYESKVNGHRSLSWDAFVAMVESQYPDAASFMSADPFVADELADDVDPDGAAGDWVKTAMQAAREGDKPDLSQLEHCALITGCEDRQTSADSTFDGRANGALTWAIVTVLKECEDVPSYRELIAKVRGKLAQGAYEQNPSLSCPDEVADMPFICEGLVAEGGDQDEDAGEEEE